MEQKGRRKAAGNRRRSRRARRLPFMQSPGTPVIPARDNEIRRWVDQWDVECKIDDRKDWGQPDAGVQNRQAVEFPIGNVGQNLTLNSEGKYLYYGNLKKIKQ